MKIIETYIVPINMFGELCKLHKTANGKWFVETPSIEFHGNYALYNPGLTEITEEESQKYLKK